MGIKCHIHSLTDKTNRNFILILSHALVFLHFLKMQKRFPLNKVHFELFIIGFVLEGNVALW